jgi:integrase
MNIEVIDYATGNKIEYITHEELEYIVNGLWSKHRTQYDRVSGIKALRDAFVFSFLFFTGARLTEFLLTQKKCIDLDSKTYYVPQLKKSYWKKGTDYLSPRERFEQGLIKYVIIPLDHVPDKHIKIWNEWIRRIESDDDFIIKNAERTVRYIVEKNSKNEIGRKITPHDLRHSCGMYLVEKDLDVLKIREIMRHTNPSITFTYLRHKQSDLRKALRRVK